VFSRADVGQTFIEGLRKKMLLEKYGINNVYLIASFFLWI
jgi:hypothetical protein